MDNSSRSKPPVWAHYIQDPSWLPHAYDANADTLRFIHLPREAQRRLVFLDPRFVAGLEISPPAPVSDLLAEPIGPAAGNMHFIFHTAFCCSTLLTRVLDIPGIAMGVKEPSVLVSFADVGTRTDNPQKRRALGLTLDLLARPLASGESQIIKPSNTINHLIPHVLDMRADAKAVFLFSTLDAFLRAVAAGGNERRAFCRRTYLKMAYTMPLSLPLRADAVMLMTDLQIAALLWLTQAAFLDSMMQRYGTSRVRALNADSFLRDKAQTLLSVARLFDLPLGTEQASEIASAHVFSEHAKEHRRTFDADTYKAQHDAASAAHGADILSVLDWTKELAAKNGAPLALSETLT